MSARLQRILEMTLERLTYTVDTYLPPALAFIVIFFAFYGIAALARWLLNRVFKGAAIDRFLRQSGVTSLLFRSGRLRATRIVAGAVFWIILGAGVLTGVNAFDTALSSQLVEMTVLLAPKLVASGFILLIGFWAAQYFGRSALVWAVNEDWPNPRFVSSAVRMLIVFASVVAAADYLNFAKNVFLAAFVLIVGGAVLALSLSFGLGSKGFPQRYFGPESRTEEESFWKHL
jgi:hypothetical protein